MLRFVQLRRIESDLYKAEAIFFATGIGNSDVSDNRDTLNVQAPDHFSGGDLLKMMYRRGKWIETRVYEHPKRAKEVLSGESEEPKASEESETFVPIIVSGPLNYKPEWADFPPVERLRAWIAASDRPTISILIPSQDRIPLLMACLLSIEETTRGYAVEVVIGDSGSKSDTFNFYRSIGIRVVHFSQPFNFSVVCNGLAAVAKGEHLLFLNNDTKALTPGWPKVLIGRRNEVIGAVLVHDKDPQLIHHAGLEIGPHPNSGNVVPFYSGHTGYRTPIHEIDQLDTKKPIAVTGAFLAVSKKVFFRLGGFDVAFRLDLQDADFCIRAREIGVKVSVSTSVVFSHVSSGSREGGQLDFPENNWKFFSGRRGKSIYQWDAVGNVSPRKEQGRVLIIDDHAPDPNVGLHVPRAKSILEFMAALDYRVSVFQTLNQNVSREWLDRMLYLGIDVVTDSPDFNAFSRERAGFYDTVYISRPHNLRRFFNLARSRFPKAQIIYDAEALFYVREKLKAALFGLNPERSNAEERLELDMMGPADKIVSVSEAEKKIIEASRPALRGKVHVWGHSLPLRPTSGGFRDRRGILFTGNLNADNPNEDSIMYFAQEILPEVRSKIECSLAITGSNPTERVRNLADGSIRVTGYLTESQLLDYYKSYRVFIVPTRFAAGIPWKLHEAMSYGIPAVVTDLIAAQLGLKDGQGVLVARTPKEFAHKVIRLYTEETLWNYVRMTCLDTIRATCDPETMKKELGKILSRKE